MRIIKRKQANKEYYYIQHSYRKNHKVITKQKYLGTEIPKEIEDIKKQIEREIKKHLYQQLENIKEKFHKEWERTPETIKEKQKQEIAITFTYNTNAIEGSTITLEETREIVKDQLSPNKPLRDVKETEKHYKIFLQMLQNKEEITNELILKWHKQIFEETKEEISGKYREYLVRVGNYLAPDWQDVKKLMNRLIKYTNTERINEVELAAITHYRFEKIHPFGDGNGRIGRLLLNYILWHNKYPMIIIEKRKRKAYYKALNKNEEEFVKYFIKLYLRIHK